MKFLRDLLDKVEPHFLPGGSQEKLYPFYEANDTFLFTPGETAEGATHVRDSIDLKRMMITVVIALIPCILMAMYNTGYQTNRIIEAASNPMTYDVNGDGSLTAEELPASNVDIYEVSVDAPPSLRSLFPAMDVNGDGIVNSAEAIKANDDGVLLKSVAPSGWTLAGARYKILDTLGISYSKAGSFFNLGTLIPCLLHGALYFLPIYAVTMFVGGHAEVVFSIIRKHEINEGFLVTGMLYPLTLPATIPLWQVAVGILFGVIIGKEIFGGTGRNFLNPALTARAFLYFAYPLEITGTKTWVPVDGYSGATALGSLADAKVDVAALAGDGAVREMAQTRATDAITNLPIQYEGVTVLENTATASQSFMNFFIGNVHGSLGETSVLACLLGAALLIATGIGSWRIMAGCTAGLLALGAAVYGIGGESPIFNVQPHWHLVIGSFAFGTVFMATDPVSASMTNTGRWIYGFVIGAITIMVRVINPAFPEGVMLAILFGNCCAPLIDYWVVQQNIKRRLARNGS